MNSSSNVERLNQFVGASEPDARHRRWFAFVCLMLASFSASAQFEEVPVTFNSQGVMLSGTIVYPTVSPPEAGVVFVHGSGRQPRTLWVARAFAKDGIAALVYDKRGVGDSGGTFEGKQPVSETNLDLLAADASAALQELASQAPMKDVPVGFTGLSQAGWIVPIALKRSDAAFLVLWSGPVCKISEEDIYSKYTRNLDVNDAPPYADALAARTTPYEWPSFLGRDTDSAEDLRDIALPGLWVFGLDDGSVPVDLSVQRLQTLQAEGHDFDYVLFSGVGHVNLRESFSTVNSWIKRAVMKSETAGGD